jgi:hypothetical protein
MQRKESATKYYNITEFINILRVATSGLNAVYIYAHINNLSAWQLA